MTTWIEGARSFFLGSQAFLIEDDREMASSWASSHILHNPAHKWVLGRFVESDRANNNRQQFTLEGLQMARPTITHAPMNLNHQQHKVVGAFVATELVYPTAAPAKADGSAPICPVEGCGTTMALSNDDAFCPTCEPEKVTAFEAAVDAMGIALNPYIDALGVFWKHYFPREYALVEAAHAEGRLFYSMECIPSDIKCVGDGGCSKEFAYVGRQSDTYCDHLNESSSDKLLVNPHFTAGAILIPPVNPGWSHADIHTLVAGHQQMAQNIFDDVKEELPHLSPDEWESLMGELLALAR